MSKTFALPLLLTMVLALAAPVAVSARPDHEGGRQGGSAGHQGGWRGGEGRGEPRGGAPYGRGYPQGGDGRVYRPDRMPQGAEYPPYGRDPREGGPFYAEPPPQRRPYNSLREGWREQQDEAREGVRNGELRPLGQIIPSLRNRMPGRMLDTGIEEGPDGRAVYRIRWAAQNGRRVDFIVDARTGAVLGTEGQ